MSWTNSENTSPLPLRRVFDKFGDILCHQWNQENQLVNSNMKVPSRNPPVVWTPKSEGAPDQDMGHRMNGVTLDFSLDEESTEGTKCEALVKLLENSLREAKLLHLQCGEVLLPHDLTSRVAEDILLMSEYEPCGLRGCIIYIHVQDKKADRRRVGVVKCDPNTVATFELHLTLYQDTSSWLSLRHMIPNKLLKSMGRQTTLVISKDYLIDKKKLYRSGSL